MRKLSFLLFFFLFFCGSDDDNKKTCDDGYLLSLYISCESNDGHELIFLSLQEGNRLTNIINASDETCFMVNGVSSLGVSFEGLVRTGTSYTPISFFDCSTFCPGCFALSCDDC